MSLRRTLAATCSAALLAAGLTACSGGDDGTPVTIATQNFDEALLVTAMYDVLLTEEGYDVDTEPVDTRDAYMAKFPDSVDIVPEYVTGIGEFLNTDANGEGVEPITTADTDASVTAIEPLATKKGITLLDPSETNSQNAYFVSQDYSESEGVTKLSDLEGKSVVLAAAPDCEGRGDCEAGLKSTYGIKITKLLGLGYASPETYKAVQDGEAQVGQTGTLDVTLADEGLLLLEDDKGLQPAGNLIPAISSEFLKDHDDIKGPLNDLMAALDNETLGELLVRVTVDREKAEDVAEDFLKQEGLI